MFEDLGLINEFALHIPTLQNFLLAVRDNYKANPYHNFYHGFSVLQFCYLTLTTTRASSYLSQLDQLSLCIAGLCHDLHHPGTNNQFQENARTPLALAHNDQSILENHHAFVTFELLRTPGMQLWNTGETLHTVMMMSSECATPHTTTHMSHDGMSGSVSVNATPVTSPISSSSSASSSSSSSSPSSVRINGHQAKQLRKSIILAILSTDMTHHFAMCKEIDKLDIDNHTIFEKESDRQFLLNCITHAADLSAQCLPTPIAIEWERVSHEFAAQAVLEKRMGLPTAQFMDNLQDKKVRYKNHLFFLDLVMRPLWSGLQRLFPPFQQCLDNLYNNRKYFEHQIELLTNPNATPLTVAQTPTGAAAATPSLSLSSSTPSSAAKSLMSPKGLGRVESNSRVGSRRGSASSSTLIPHLTINSTNDHPHITVDFAPLHTPIHTPIHTPTKR